MARADNHDIDQAQFSAAVSLLHRFEMVPTSFLAWVLQHSDSVFRDSRICSRQLAGHTEAYAMLQDALWFALSLVWLCPLVAAVIFVFSH